MESYNKVDEVFLRRCVTRMPFSVLHTGRAKCQKLELLVRHAIWKSPFLPIWALLLRLLYWVGLGCGVPSCPRCNQQIILGLFWTFQTLESHPLDKIGQVQNLRLQTIDSRIPFLIARVRKHAMPCHAIRLHIHTWHPYSPTKHPGLLQHFF